MTRASFFQKFEKASESSPQLSLIVAFAAAIVAGTLLLCLPFCRTSPMSSASDAVSTLFVATSATCVTGLDPVCIATSLSPAGQLVVMLLVQLGGIGIMTFASFFVVLFGRKMSAADESFIASTIGTFGSRSMLALLAKVVSYSLTIEAVGAAVLSYRFLQLGFAPSRAVSFGVFHAISAFCNSGLTLFPNGLADLAGDATALSAIGSLVFLGGLGFVVIGSLFSLRPWKRDIRKKHRLGIHSSIVLYASLLLVLAGAVSYCATEWGTSLAGYSASGKIGVALFQAVSSRTAGFSAFDVGAVAAPSKFVTILLMFIGGAPCSTTGGIKVTTLAVLLATMLTNMRGRNHTVIRSRLIPESAVREAVTVFLLGTIFTAVACIALLITERDTGCRPFDICFEAISAFSTTGLSTIGTSNVSSLGKLVVVITMFIGRIGPLTIVASIGKAMQDQERISFPREDVLIG